MNTIRYIVSDGVRYVERVYTKHYKVYDMLTLLTPVYGGRVVATNALTYDTPEEAVQYARRKDLYPQFGPVAYDTCLCSVVKGGEPRAIDSSE